MQPALCRVICMGCGNTSPRQPFQDLLAELNPEAAEHVKRLVAAGHDAEAARQRSLRVGASEEEIRQVWTPSLNRHFPALLLLAVHWTALTGANCVENGWHNQMCLAGSQNL